MPPGDGHAATIAADLVVLHLTEVYISLKTSTEWNSNGVECEPHSLSHKVQSTFLLRHLWLPLVSTFHDLEERGW